jgi:hypothetical protein
MRKKDRAALGRMGPFGVLGAMGVGEIYLVKPTRTIKIKISDFTQIMLE